MTNKAVLYARVSSVEQKKEGYSIPAQIELLKEYAVKNNITIVQEFTDSETAKHAGRTNFNAMVSFLKKNKDIKIILVEKTDRLYRNFKDYVLIDESEYEIHLVKEGTILSENSKSHEKFIHGIKVLMAKNFIDNLSEEVKKGLRQKAEQGYYPSKPPYGYKKIDKKFSIIDPETAPFMKRAFELYAEGDKSLESVIDILENEGFVYRQDFKRIGKGQLEHLLKNIFYMGSFKYNGQVYSGLHEPLVSRLLFEKVQEAFKKDNKPLYRNEHDFIFANFIKCADCGCSISAEIKKEKYIYYRCSWGKGKANCSQHKYFKQEELEKQFDEVVKRISIIEEHKNWIIEALKLSFEDEKQYNEERITSLQSQAQKLRDRLSKLYIDKLDGIVSNEFWFEKNNEWKNQLETIETLLSAHKETSMKYLNEGIKTLELCTNAYRLYSNQNAQEKLNLLKILLQNCTLKDGKLDYTYKKPFDILAKGLAFSKKYPGQDSNL